MLLALRSVRMTTDLPERLHAGGPPEKIHCGRTEQERRLLLALP